MNNMYDILNKFNSVAGKQTLTEGAKPDFLDIDKDGDRKESMKKAAKEVDEASYSAKAAHAGKDIGKPGKAFAQIAKSAGERYGSKERGEKVAGAVLAKLRAKESVEEADMGEGNDFTGARLAAIKAGKPTFTVDGKIYKVTGNTSDEKVMEREYGNREDFDQHAKKGDIIRTAKGTLTKTDHGVKHERRADDEENMDDRDDDTPKKKGRPKGSKRALGAKGPTGKSKLLKKGSIKEADLEEDYDKDEYDEEGEMAKSQSRTIIDAAAELQSIIDDNENLPEWVQKKISLAMDYIDSARDYLAANRPSDEMAVAEVAPPGAKAERMVKHIKQGYAKDGKLTDKEKGIAYATAWKAKKAGKVEEESTETRDERAEKAGKKVAKDIEYDEKVKDKIHGHKRGSEDNKAERAGKKVTKDIEHDEKVDETTVSGSVATSAESPKGKKGGMIFGKGVYEGRLEESYKSRLETMLTEGMSINMSVGEDGRKTLNVNATDDDAIKLAQILKLAGMEQDHNHEQTCESCGQMECACESMAEGEYANSPETETADINTLMNTYSDGLNGQKTTGQTTIPVIAGQTQRTMTKVKEAAEGRLWDLYQRYDSK